MYICRDDTGQLLGFLYLYESIKETLDFCRGNGVKLKVSALTKKELSSRLKFDAKVLMKYPTRKISAVLVINTEPQITMSAHIGYELRKPGSVLVILLNTIKISTFCSKPNK